MSLLEIGKPYSSRQSWPEGSDYNLTKNGHELRLFFSSPTTEEIEDVRAGEANFGLFAEGDVLWLLYRFGNSPWSDSPFSWHQVPEALRVAPEAVQEMERMLLQVLLIDADTGILKVIRALTMSPHFSRVFHAQIERQMGEKFSAISYQSTIDKVYARMNSDEMARKCLAKCRGGH